MDFIEQARARAKELRARGAKQPMTTAMRELIAEQPDLHAEWLEAQKPVALDDVDGARVTRLATARALAEKHKRPLRDALSALSQADAESRRTGA